ncbi:MAG: Phenazine biosynthesis protein PhzF like [Ignavibacteriae bacterium]|nr:MAG: Phenazine biosynthesis protein PhzF like [Ignavibacteriota bacterium]
MKKIPIKQVDAFTRIPYQGNPAGVVNEASYLNDLQMQLIAKEMNLSETAFILPPRMPEADMRIRWFTPVCEVPLCGHATIAALHSLAEDGLYGMMNNGKYNFNIETKSGILFSEVIKENNEIKINLGITPPNRYERFSQYKLDLVRILNINISDVDSKPPIMRNDFVFVPIRRLHVLYALKPNLFALTNFMNQRNLHGLCVFTFETIEKESFIHVRFFAPNEGISEDPVTGSVHSPLAAYLFENGMLEVKDGQFEYIAEQGDSIGRKGRVQVKLEVENNKPKVVKIGGNAVTIFKTEIIIPQI